MVALPFGPGSAYADPSVAMSVFGEEGDFITDGVPSILRAERGEVSVSVFPYSVEVFTVGGDRIDARASPNLGPGLFAEPGSPWIGGTGYLNHGREFRGCSEAAGRFDVKEFERKKQRVKRVWLSFQQPCGGTTSSFGEVRIPLPKSDGLLTTPSSVWFPDAYPGVIGPSATIQVLNDGATSRYVADTGVRGLDREDFTLSGDGCYGEWLLPSESCTLIVRFSPLGAGPRSATLEVTDGEKALKVPLDGFGFPGRTQMTLDGEPGSEVLSGRLELRPRAYKVTASGDSNQVNMFARGDGDYGATLAAAPGDTLTEGIYEGATTADDSARVGPGIDVEAADCSDDEVTGSFEILRLRKGQNETIEQLDATFEQRCVGATGTMRGRLEYRAPVGDTNAPGAPGELVVERDGRRAEISWSNPSAEDFRQTFIRYLAGPNFPGAPTSALPAYIGDGESASVSVPKGSRIKVAAWSVDDAGNVSPVTQATLEPRR